MSPLRTASMKLLLVLALLLPLQSFASAWNCGDRTTGAAAAHHCVNEPEKTQTGAEQQHHCGSCCAAAIALMPFRWTAPRCPSPEHAPPSQGPAPKVALDRLDRPPRHLA